MRALDFTSWHSLLATLIGLALFTLIGVGVRLVMMMTIQHRRERMNRQINERLRVLIAAYKVLGGSFTGNLAVDPTHKRDLRDQDDMPGEGDGVALLDPEDHGPINSDRARRIRDAVEAVLADVILLGTDEQVRLAERAARELVAGRPVHVHELVVSLRNFVREALDLDPIPTELAIPMQGPTRPSSSGSGGKGRDGAREGERGGGRGAGGGMGGGAGMGAGMGLGLGGGTALASDSGESQILPDQKT